MLLGLLIGVSVFWWRSSAGSDVEALAERLPANSLAGWAVDGADPVELLDWSKDSVALIAAYSDEKEITWDKLEESLGMEPEAFARLFDGRAYAGSVSQDSKTLSFTAVGLADSEGFAQWWESKPRGGEEQLEVEGVTFQKIGSSELIGWDSQWLYMSSGEAAAQKFLEFAKSGGDSLADSELFEEGCKELKVDDYDGFVFFNLQLAADEARAQAPELGDKVIAEIATFRYALGTINFEDLEVKGILATQKDPSGIAAKFCIPGTVSGDALARLSDDTNNYACLDLKWVQDVTMGLLSLSDKTRSYSALIGLGIAAKGNPWSGLKGEVAVTTNVVEIMTESFKTLAPDELRVEKHLGPTKGNMVVSAAVKDTTRAHGLLKSYMSITGPTPESGEEQDYSLTGDSSLRLSDAAPAALLLMAGPEPESLLASGSGADKHPAIKDSLKWADGGVVYLDHWDATSAAESLLEGIKGRDDSKSVATRNLLHRLQKRFPSLHGSSCLAASEEGLRYRSTGPLNSVVMASALSAYGMMEKKQKRALRRKKRQKARDRKRRSRRSRSRR